MFPLSYAPFISNSRACTQINRISEFFGIPFLISKRTELYETIVPNLYRVSYESAFLSVVKFPKSIVSMLISLTKRILSMDMAILLYGYNYPIDMVSDGKQLKENAIDLLKLILVTSYPALYAME